MNTTTLGQFFRSQVRDDVKPYLWSDEEMFVYMNAAQEMFVRLTGGIFDVTSEATDVSVAAGEKYSELHPKILHIRSANLLDPAGTRELRVINLADAQKLTTSDYGVVINTSLTELPGRVEYMVIGEERNLCRWIRLPAADYAVKLVVTRLPLEDLTEFDQDLEVADEHHVSLVDWMMALAYRKQDADVYDPKASESREASFRVYCEQVWKEWERYRHKPRSVAYGGI